MATPPLATYDLHLHTYWSYDATAHVESYFRRAEALGLRCIAITEHHNLDSLADTGKAARRYPTVRWLRAAELTVTLSAGTWAAILMGDKKVESAFLQGKLKVDGKPEAALPLRAAFGL